MTSRADDLTVHRSGSGRPFLWGHGLLSSMAGEDANGPIRWPDVDLPDLELIRWDARGHGSSAAAEEPADCRWESLASDALSVADRVGATTFTAGGASMGAATAIWTAVAAPERVERLVLAIPPSAWQRRRPTKLLYGVGGTIAGAVPLGGLRRRSVALRGAAESDLPDPDVIRTLTMPTLVLAWRADPVHPSSIAGRLADLLPVADLVVTGRPFDVTGWIDALADFLAY